MKHGLEFKLQSLKFCTLQKLFTKFVTVTDIIKSQHFDRLLRPQQEPRPNTSDNYMFILLRSNLPLH